MARVELTPEEIDDFDRFFGHMVGFGVDDAPERIAQIVLAMQVLTHSPLIGRSRAGGKRELVIGHGTRGFVVLYRFVTALDTVFVLMIRNQREAGFRCDT